MLNLALIVFIVGVAAAGLAALIRSVPWPQRMKDRKPLGCIACMSAWCALVLLLLASLAGYVEWREEDVNSYVGGVVLWLAATGVSVYVLGQSGVFSDWSAPLGTGPEDHSP